MGGAIAHARMWGCEGLGLQSHTLATGIEAVDPPRGYLIIVDRNEAQFFMSNI